MRILTYGMSPFLNTSRAKIHASVIEHLNESAHDIGSIVWAHDIQYFAPETDVNGGVVWFYDYEVDDEKKTSPIWPLLGNENDSVLLYELVKTIDPDVILAVGDCQDIAPLVAFQQVAGSHCPSVLIWTYYGQQDLNVLANIEKFDRVLCLNHQAEEFASKTLGSDRVIFSYVGADDSLESSASSDGFSLVVTGRNTWIDNVPTILEAVVAAKGIIEDLSLYLHVTNDPSGDFDIAYLARLYDPDSSYISLPNSYVSIQDGVPAAELMRKICEADVFISASMVSATSLAAFEAASCGCTPLLSDCGSNRNIINVVKEQQEDSQKTMDIGIHVEPFIGPGGMPMSLATVDSIVKAILSSYEGLKKSEEAKEIVPKILNNYRRKDFLGATSNLIFGSMKNANRVQVESL